MGSVKYPRLPGIPVVDPLLLDAAKVVTAYAPIVATARWAPLGTAGGFSGGRIWRGVAADGRAFALKAHPPGTDARRLETTIHRWMVTARQAGLSFVPAVERTRAGRSLVETGGRVWDVTDWMPGRADFHDDPSDSRLVAAVTAVARVHVAWAGEMGSTPCPAVVRRWQALQEWEELLASGWQPRFDSGDPIRPTADAAFVCLPRAVVAARSALLPWLDRPVPVQPCLCDVWHDHVLYEGERVSGLVDYAAMKVDHVAVDLSRLLGSLVPNDSARTDAALRAYAGIRPLPHPELVPILDRTGTVVAVVNWLRWIYHERRDYADRARVADRLSGLLRRIEVMA